MVRLKAYSGHRLNILSQVNLSLTHGSRTIEAVVLVQEGAPHKLLLGTDLQPKLGFRLLVEEEASLTDLLTGEECSRRRCGHVNGVSWNILSYSSYLRSSASLYFSPTEPSRGKTDQVPLSSSRTMGWSPSTYKRGLLWALFFL